VETGTVMKKCPEKFNLYQVLDSENKEKVDSEIELHLKNCSACREELEQIRKVETALKKQVDTVLADSPVKKNVVERISKTEIQADNEDRAKKQKSPLWFWILAPGILIILVAAISMSIGKKEVHYLSLTCMAASNDSLVNQSNLSMGSQINLTGAHLPVQFAGDFIFTVTKSGVKSVFKLSGEASLDSIRDNTLEFKGDTASFKLVEGPDITMFFNSKKLKLSKDVNKADPLSKNISDGETGKVEHQLNNGSCSSKIADIRQKDDQKTSHTGKKIASGSKTSSASLTVFISTCTVDVKSLEDDSVKDNASKTQNSHENLNPFLDKPLEIQGN
jgi:hypothetical protein